MYSENTNFRNGVVCNAGRASLLFSNHHSCRNLKRICAAEGDKFEIIEKDGGIFLCPVVVYTKAEMERIAKLIKDAESKTGSLKAYDDVSIKSWVSGFSIVAGLA